MASQDIDTRETQGAPEARLRPRLDGRPPAPHGRDSFFARGRVRWLRRCLDDLGERPENMVTLGWGHGITTSEFFAYLKIRSLMTVDVGREWSRAGELRSADGRATYIHVADYRAGESADLAFVNGVFDRMAGTDRAAAAVLMYRSLKSGGLFSVWQNNPWSPGTMLGAMPRESGDSVRHITPPELRRVLRGVGFDIVHTTSAFFFPRRLSWAHGLEPLLAPIPLGRQYMVLARKP